MKLSATQAAKETGKTTATITRAIKNGRLSAKKTDEGGYEIDPAELYRVYPPIADDTAKDTVDNSQVLRVETTMLQAENRLLREQLEDLRRDRDEWRETCQQAQRLIGHDRPQNEPKQGLLKRIFG